MQLAASRSHTSRPVPALTACRPSVRPTVRVPGGRPRGGNRRAKPHEVGRPGRRRVVSAPRYAALRDRHRCRPRPVRPRDRPVRGRRGRCRRHPRAHRGRAARRRPGARLRLGPDRRPHRRDPRAPSTTPTCRASARRPSRATRASCARSRSATPAAGPWSTAPAPTTTRGAACARSCTASAPPPPRAARPSSSPTAAAACARSGRPARPVLISDHINLTATSPIEGANFVDLTDLYSPRLRAVAKRDRPDASTRASTCSSAGRTTRPRPRCGWPASSAATWSACRPRSRRSPPARAGLEVLGISLVTNLAAGISTTPLNHEEVLEAGRRRRRALRPPARRRRRPDLRPAMRDAADAPLADLLAAARAWAADDPDAVTRAELDGLAAAAEAGDEAAASRARRRDGRAARVRHRRAARRASAAARTG